MSDIVDGILRVPPHVLLRVSESAAKQRLDERAIQPQKPPCQVAEANEGIPPYSDVGMYCEFRTDGLRPGEVVPIESHRDRDVEHLRRIAARDDGLRRCLTTELHGFVSQLLVHAFGGITLELTCRRSESAVAEPRLPERLAGAAPR